MNDGTKQLTNQNFPKRLQFREVTVFTYARGVRFSVALQTGQIGIF